MAKSVGISYGALGGTIKSQLRKQGYVCDKEVVDRFEKERDAITRLRFGRLLSDSAASKLFAKLHKKVVAHVEKSNP